MFGSHSWRGTYDKILLERVITRNNNLVQIVPMFYGKLQLLENGTTAFLFATSLAPGSWEQGLLTPSKEHGYETADWAWVTGKHPAPHMTRHEDFEMSQESYQLLHVWFPWMIGGGEGRRRECVCIFRVSLINQKTRRTGRIFFLFFFPVKAGRGYGGHMDNICRFHGKRFDILDRDIWHQRDNLQTRYRLLPMETRAEMFKKRCVDLI